MQLLLCVVVLKIERIIVNKTLSDLKLVLFVAGHIEIWCRRKKISFNEKVRADIKSTIRTFRIEARTKNSSKEKSTDKEKKADDLSQIVDSDDDH